MAAVAPRLAPVRDAREHLAMLAKTRRIAGPQAEKPATAEAGRAEARALAVTY